jgi:bifunctional oligoribonuclease and PAP phosphatase NrnA
MFMNTTEIAKQVQTAKRILLIQADNPDADSLGSALALEHILGDMGKETFLYCGVDIPSYLKYMDGWDRVSKNIPKNFDLSIIVDTSALALLQILESSTERAWVASRPAIVLDHHEGVKCDIPYVTLVINDSTKVSTGELIYSLAKELGWQLNLAASELITNSILADSMGLSTANTTATTYRVVADLVEGGVNRPKLEEQRRALNRMPEVIFRYKAELIRRTELHAEGRLALVTVPQHEINEYSPLYNPAPLIQSDHLQVEGVSVSIVLKIYDSGRITGAIRANNNAPIAAALAESFEGGGHAYAAGFKVELTTLEKIRKKAIQTTEELLKKVAK